VWKINPYTRHILIASTVGIKIEHLSGAHHPVGKAPIGKFSSESDEITYLYFVHTNR
jgi:hypothetical protein